MSDDTILDTLKRASTSVYIVAEEEVAKHISITMRRAVTEIEKLQAENTALKAELTRITPFINATERYKREIAQQGEEG